MKADTMLERDVSVFYGWLSLNAVGAANGQRAKTIGDALGFTDRYLRALANAAVESGLLVCSGQSGYFVPASSSEVTETLHRLRSQASVMHTRADAIRRLARRRWLRDPAWRTGTDGPLVQASGGSNEEAAATAAQ